MNVSTILLIAAQLAVTPFALADTLSLSIEEAVGRALPAAESLKAVAADANAALASVRVAQSGYWPQVNTFAAYSRTIRSEYEDCNRPVTGYAASWVG